MSQTIGSAADFYRIRVRFIDTTDPVDFEWRDDVLYRSPEPLTIQEEGEYLVEALFLDDDSVANVLARFADGGSAHTYAADRQYDLETMTRAQFEEQFFSRHDTPDDAVRHDLQDMHSDADEHSR